MIRLSDADVDGEACKGQYLLHDYIDVWIFTCPKQRVSQVVVLLDCEGIRDVRLVVAEEHGFCGDAIDGYGGEIWYRCHCTLAKCLVHISSYRNIVDESQDLALGSDECA